MSELPGDKYYDEHAPKTPYEQHLERERRKKIGPPKEPPVRDMGTPHHSDHEECPVCFGKGYIVVLREQDE